MKYIILSLVFISCSIKSNYQEGNCFLHTNEETISRIDDNVYNEDDEAYKIHYNYIDTSQGLKEYKTRSLKDFKKKYPNKIHCWHYQSTVNIFEYIKAINKKDKK